MSELWAQVAALGETRHQVIMVLLDGALEDPDDARTPEIYTAIDDINDIVDKIDKTNPVAILRAHNVLNGMLAQLQRATLVAQVNRSRSPAQSSATGESPSDHAS